MGKIVAMIWKNLQPDLHCQGVHEAEQSGGLPAGDLEEDGDAQVHEGLGEVNDALPGKVDGHGPDSDVRLVLHQLPDQAVPLPGGEVQGPVVVVLHQLNVVIEANLHMVE